MRFTTTTLLAIPLIASAILALPQPGVVAERGLGGLDQYEHGTLAIREAAGELEYLEDRDLEERDPGAFDQYEHGTLAIREAAGDLEFFERGAEVFEEHAALLQRELLQRASPALNSTELEARKVSLRIDRTHASLSHVPLLAKGPQSTQSPIATRLHPSSGSSTLAGTRELPMVSLGQRSRQP